MTDSKLVIGDMRTLDRHGASNKIYLVPAEETADGTVRVVMSSDPSGGWPMMAYHHRWLSLGSVNHRAVDSAIEDALREHEGEILALAEKYMGTRWDGHNNIGEWQLDDEATDEISQALGEVSTWSEASDYYISWDDDSLLAEVCKPGESARDIAKREVDAADGVEYTLAVSDVEGYLRRCAKRWLESHDAVDDDEQAASIRACVASWEA